MATDLSIYEGEDKIWTVTIVDSSGDPIDITGYTFLFVVKNKISDSDSDAIISKEITSHTDPTGGVTQIAIDSADTAGQNGKFIYDYQWLDATSKRRVILKKATFTVLQRVGDTFS